MNPVYIRVASYILLPLIGAAAAWAAVHIPGFTYNEANGLMCVNLESLVGKMLTGAGIGATAAVSIFAAWGNKAAAK